MEHSTKSPQLKVSDSTTTASSTLHRKSSMISDTSDDNDNSDKYSMSSSVYDANASMLSEGSFAEGDDMSSSTIREKKGRISNPNAKFITKSEWKKNKNCNVCAREIDKMKGINPHHCRICASRVCGECSKKKVNGSRVCDICYFRQKIEVHEKRRENYIKERGGMIVRAQVMLEKKGEELKQVGRKRSDLIEESNLSENVYAQNLELEKQAKIEAEKELQEKLEVTKGICEKIEKEKKVVEEKEDKLKQVQDKLAKMRLEISKKKAILDNKKEELETLLHTKLALENHEPPSASASFVSTGSKASFASTKNNIHLAPQQKGGKYNISLQPVDI